MSSKDERMRGGYQTELKKGYQPCPSGKPA